MRKLKIIWLIFLCSVVIIVSSLIVLSPVLILTGNYEWNYFQRLPFCILSSFVGCGFIKKAIRITKRKIVSMKK